MAGPRQVRLLGRTSPHSQSEPQGQGRAAPTPRPLKSSEQFAVFKSVFTDSLLKGGAPPTP